MIKLRRIIGVIGSSAAYLSFAALTFAADPIPIKPGLQEGSGVKIITGQTIDVNSVISFVITVLATVAIVAAVLWLIWGAIKWITSGGDKEKVESARGTIIAAVIGLVILILVFVILNFVAGLLGVGDLFHIQIKPLSESLQSTGSNP